jgi:hypothetical protein
MPAMSPVQEEMEQGTGEKKHVRQRSKEMSPVLREQEKPKNG